MKSDNISRLSELHFLISKFQITLSLLCLHFSSAKDVKESSLTVFTDDMGWKTGDDRSAQLKRKVPHKSAFPELTDQFTRDFTKAGKLVNSVSDSFRRLIIRRINPCVDSYVWKRSACGSSRRLVPRCRKTSWTGCSSSIRCHGTRKCITIQKRYPACNQDYITECACSPAKCLTTENLKKII